MRRWLQFALSLTVAVSLAAAPCRNCRPPASAPVQAGHDCCPRQAPAEDCGAGDLSECKWQPSEKAAPEPKVETGGQPGAIAPAGFHTLERATVHGPFPPAPAPSVSPPLFLLHSVLLI
jgi:hypothetical protein